MPSLSITYAAEARRAVLSFDAPSPAWDQIRRVCEEHSDNVEVTSVNSLSIPWWEFLSCLQAIGYHVSRRKIDLKIDQLAAALIEKSKDRRTSYSEAKSALSLESTAVLEQLSRTGFQRELTPEQLSNVCKLVSLPSGATFSVPGAGKTTEALAVFFFRAKEDTRLLVVAPKNAFAAWEEQLKLCVPDLGYSFVRLTGGEARIRQQVERLPRLMLITYHQLPFVKGLIGALINDRTFVFLDESHRIKRGLDGKIGGTLLSISHIPPLKLIMSGTPMPNSEADLVPQFNFLFPEVAVSDETVTDAIRPIYVRTTKTQLGLRKPDRWLVEVPLGGAQRRLYELLRSETARHAEKALKARDRNRLRALGRSVLRLIQLTSNPALLARTGDIHPEIVADILAEGDSPKLLFACHRAREIVSKGGKVVIWSSFIDNVELVARRLRDLGADFIHGGIDAGSEEEEDTREWKIKRFHRPDSHWVLVANPAACGEGISLHEVCHNAIYLDRNYNAAQYLQSEDRIHRLGLHKEQSTTVEILCCPDTVDVSVDRRLRTKIGRMAAALEDKDLHIDPVSFDPNYVDDNEALDEEDVSDLLRHLTERVPL